MLVTMPQGGQEALMSGGGQKGGGEQETREADIPGRTKSKMKGEEPVRKDSNCGNFYRANSKFEGLGIDLVPETTLWLQLELFNAASLGSNSTHFSKNHSNSKS